MDAGNHQLLVWQTLQHIRLFYTCRPLKIVFYQFSAKVRCYLFITSSNPHASPSSDVLASHLLESPRPRVPASPPPHVLDSLPPHVPASPRPHVPTSPRPRVPASSSPRVPKSQVPRPRRTFSNSRVLGLPQNNTREQSWNYFATFPRSSARNSQIRFKVSHLFDSYVLKFPSSKRTYEIYDELRKSPVKRFVKCTVIWVSTKHWPPVNWTPVNWPPVNWPPTDPL